MHAAGHAPLQSPRPLSPVAATSALKMDDPDGLLLNISFGSEPKAKPTAPKPPRPAGVPATAAGAAAREEPARRHHADAAARPPQPAANGSSFNKAQHKPSQNSKRPQFKLPTTNRKQPVDPDSLDAILQGGDDGEADDVAAAVAAVLGREQQLQQEGSNGSHEATANHAQQDGVVEFYDSGDEGHGAAAAAAGRKPMKRARKSGGAAAAANGTQGSSAKREAPTAIRPGQFVHAESVPVGSRAALFGAPPPQLQGGAAGDAATFESLGLGPVLAQHLQALKFECPTVVQRAAIPVLLSCRDALVKAPTGSGKTLAYLAPIVQSLQARTPRICRSDGTAAIIIVPTRELALQIHDVAVLLLRRFCWLVPGLLIGGEHRGHEKARLRKGVSVLAATPGRLLDHLQNTASFRVSGLTWLVLDEADRLLDLGFEEKLRHILNALATARAAAAAGGGKGAVAAAAPGGGGGGPAALHLQTVMLSATLPSKLTQLAAESLHEPVAVGFAASQVGGGAEEAGPASGTAGVDGAAAAGAANDDEKFELPPQLRQAFVEVPAKLRLMALAALLRARVGAAHRSRSSAKVVVFVSSCDQVEFYHTVLHDGGLAAACELPAGTQSFLPAGCPVFKLHGDMAQEQRTRTFVGFCDAPSGVLLCTDVAARGLDFPAVTSIVQADAPGAVSEYVHRVGRTARCGHKGDATLLLLPSERHYVDLLHHRGVVLQQERLESLLQWLPLPQGALAGGSSSSSSSSGGAAAAAAAAGGPYRHKDAERSAALLQRSLINVVSVDSKLCGLGADAFRSFVRSYATHSGDVKQIFHVRRLHLGHIAASFGLKESPGLMGRSGSSAERKRKKHEAAMQGRNTSRKKQRRILAAGEG